MAIEIERQLADYCSWLESEIGAELSARSQLTTVEDVPSRSSVWSRFAMIAAASVLIVAAGVVLIGRDDTSEPVEPPPVDTLPTVTTSPRTPATTSTPTPTTVPATSVITDVGTVQAAGVWQNVEPQRTVLYETTVGSGDGQIGQEDCRECDPGRAFNPVLLPDQTVVIPDTFNGRWLVVRDGAATAVPFDVEHGGFLGAFVSDGDGNIYGVRNVALTGEQARQGEVVVFDLDHLTEPIRTYPIGEIEPFTSLKLVEDGLLYEFGSGPRSGVINLGPTYRGVPMPAVSWDTLDADRDAVEVTWQDKRRRWEFPADQYIATTVDIQPGLSDGSILVFVGNKTDDTEQYWARLFPDGRLAAIPATPSWSFNSMRSLDDNGLTQIEKVGDHLEVAHYALPTIDSAPTQSTILLTTTTAPATSVSTTPVVVPTGSIQVTAADLYIVHADGDLYLHPGILTDNPAEPIRLADRDDPRVEVGDGRFPNHVEQVAGEHGGVVYYGDCCEPVSGNVYAVTQPDDVVQPRFVGSFPQLSPDDTQLGSASPNSVAIIDLDTGLRRSLPINQTIDYLNVWDAIWSADGTTFNVLYFDNSSYGIVTYDADTLDAAQPIPIDLPFNAPGEPDAHFAGHGPNGELAITVTRPESTTIQFYDPDTFQHVPSLDRTLPAGVRSVRLAADGIGLLWNDNENLYYLPQGGTVRQLGNNFAAAWFARG